MKRWIAFILAIVLLMGCATGCSSSSSNEPSSQETTNGKTNQDSSTPAEPEVQEYYYEKGEVRVNTWKNSIGTVWVQVAMPIYNGGTKDLYLGSCKFDLEDSGGHLVDTVEMVSSCPEVLQPGETGWYYGENTLDISEPQELVGIAHENVEKASVKCIRFDISDVTIKDGSFMGIEIVGRVENTTDKDESLAKIAFNLFDAEGNLLASLYTYENVKAGEKIGFSLSGLSLPDNINAAAVDHYEAYGYPTQFNW